MLISNENVALLKEKKTKNVIFKLCSTLNISTYILWLTQLVKSCVSLHSSSDVMCIVHTGHTKKPNKTLKYYLFSL